MSITNPDWANLNHLQVGRYAEYVVKMEFTRAGLDVYTAEVDDKGIDFVIRRDAATYFDIQVKSIRGLNYVFFPKDKFRREEEPWAVVVLFEQGVPPQLFLIPASAWDTPSDLLRSHDYEGKKSKPEWGINISKKNMHLLKAFAFEKTIGRLIGETTG